RLAAHRHALRQACPQLSCRYLDDWHALLDQAMSPDPNPTLAELLMPLPAANPFSTMRASLRWYSSEELEDGVAYGGQSWLRRGSVDSFFPRCCCETAMLQEGVSDHRHERMTVKALP